MEAELGELAAEDRREYLDSLGVEEGGLKSLVRASYSLLGLRTYFTCGEKARTKAGRALQTPRRCTASSLRFFLFTIATCEVVLLFSFLFWAVLCGPQRMGRLRGCTVAAHPCVLYCS